MPLRARLALLTAVAVAVAVAACASAAWFLVRGQLLDSLDEALRTNRVPASLVVQQINAGQCTAVPSEQREATPNPFDSTVQIVDRNGTSCIVFGQQPLAVGTQDVAVARGLEQESIRRVRAADGTEYRALTRPLEGTDAAVTVARPLDEVNDALDTLALVLGLVAAAGVLGAAGAGVALARAGLRPVDRLAQAVEHVARTEDLAVRIPVSGDDEIARLSRSFNMMTEALAASREVQQQLIADAGHELRTPLTSMRMNIDLLVRSEESGRALPPGERAELLASVRSQMAELGALIGDLQELSRPDQVPGQGQWDIVPLHEVTERAVARARLRGTGITVEADLSSWYVRAEPAALERAVVNLLDNAVKFSPSGGTVEVALDGGELRVRDRGPGIAEEELPRVFDRFWRSPAARSLPGSGLGLAIVARTVARAGGEVELRPADGGGTLAVVRLPGAAVPPPAQPAPEGPVLEGPVLEGPVLEGPAPGQPAADSRRGGPAGADSAGTGPTGSAGATDGEPPART
ncbi:HAMP domain-containing sensor histidine kinase [Streptomyces sp. 549]|uniref:sensor histidine kinase n=1 Tax=Streptomyces sp. 549 TaxID=3049076 RepID=UPI0024C3ED6B|nr:HAMP domain-containing sensor histidine kinase [Streptomyces sp. 549]MDK1472385.1 HAMP domain-containing sensor histidine kinase [Streptomyces sp. 549]